MNEETISIAPIPSRLLALFIDYIFLSALLFFTGTALGDSDFNFLATLFITGFYFTFCNSELCSGQTLGKKALGLRTVSLSGKSVFLDPSASALRYLSSFGILILISEIPVFFFSQFSVVAPRYLLELHMLLALCLASTSLLLTFFTHSKKSIHDIICNSLVLRSPTVPKTPVHDERQNVRDSRRLPVALIGIVLASFLWALGLNQPSLVSKVSQSKYVIENEFDLKIISLGLTNSRFEVIALQPHSNKKTRQEIADELGEYINSKLLPADSSTTGIDFLIHRDQDKEMPEITTFKPNK